MAFHKHVFPSSQGGLFESGCLKKVTPENLHLKHPKLNLPRLTTGGWPRGFSTRVLTTSMDIKILDDELGQDIEPRTLKKKAEIPKKNWNIAVLLPKSKFHDFHGKPYRGFLDIWFL